MKNFVGVAAALLALLMSVPAFADEGDGGYGVRRFMLAVGANDGGERRVLLRYAVSDADAMTKVFRELGGVAAEDQIQLRDPDPYTFLQAIAQLGALAQQARPDYRRLEIILYYSGHSDDQGLLLKGQHLGYSVLRDAVNRLPAEVRIVILDSCASGALTRLKGGQRRPSFLLDTSSNMQGHAYLTSASDDESAQESDLIGASFFTHALISGLRGGADATQDERITLNEAYQFAFYETLARTEGTQTGAQHPAYDIQMAGSGDLVMTDLRGRSAGLVLGDDLTGRLRIRDAQNQLVVELMKPQGRSVELGLEPGDYRVIIDRGGVYFSKDVTLIDGDLALVSGEDLELIATELTVARGDAGLSDEERLRESYEKKVRHWREPEGGFIFPRFSGSLWPGLSTNGADEKRAISEVSLNLTLGRTGGVKGLELGLLGNSDLYDVTGCQIAGAMNMVEGSVAACQVAGLLNSVMGDVKHLQLAGLVNTVKGKVSGVQGSSVLNFTKGGLRGVQLGLIDIVVGDLAGVQLSGWIGLARGNADGCLQMSGWANYVGGDFKGLQWSGAVNAVLGEGSLGQFASAANYVRGRLVGFQATGGVNLAREIDGCQLGTLNLAERAHGAQLGVVNIARNVKGLQFGLVNVAETMDGAPVGVINYARDGQQRLQLWTSDTAEGTVALKLGNRNAYSLLAFGSQELGRDDRMFIGFGLGGEFNHTERVFTTADLMAYHILEDGEWGEGVHLLAKARIGLGFRVADRLAVVGGATLNNYLSKRHDGEGLAHGTWGDEYDEKENLWAKAWPGFFVGLQF